MKHLELRIGIAKLHPKTNSYKTKYAVIHETNRYKSWN